MDPSSPEAASKFMTTGPEHYQALHKRCSSALSQWKEPSKAKKCVGNEYHNYGPSLQNQGKDCWGGCGSQQGACEWCGAEGYCCRLGWNGGGCNGKMGIPGKGHSCVPGPSGLLSIGIEMNRSDLRSDGVMNQLVKRGNKHTVKILVEHASDPTAMAASEEFLEVWQEFESELIAAQATSVSAALQPLRMLLGQLPVGHIDKASAFRVDGDLPLLELCAFSVAATSVAKNFPEEAGLVNDARSLLSSPTPEQSSRFTGLEADLV